VKREIERKQFVSSLGMSGWKRNKIALVLGAVSAPFLGLLAVFDTVRSPQTHLIFVLLFFPFMVAYVLVNNSVHRIVGEHQRSTSSASSSQGSPDSLAARSLTIKTIIARALIVFVILYLPVGMSLVSDWHDYSQDVMVHSFRAFCQHICVLCLMLYFGSFSLDFGDLTMTVIQYED